MPRHEAGGASTPPAAESAAPLLKAQTTRRRDPPRPANTAEQPARISCTAHRDGDPYTADGRYFFDALPPYIAGSKNNPGPATRTRTHSSVESGSIRRRR
jgi:hypothetical protein